MKHTLITIVIMFIVIGIALIGYYLQIQDKPAVYRGQIVNRVQDSFVVQVVVPATIDELIGLEIGDEYLLQEVTE